MTIYQTINLKLKQYLATSPSEEDLRKFLETILHDQSPKQAFHQMDLKTIKEPTLVYVKLMVQDIRENCYTYPYIIEKPFSEKSQTYLFKFGHNQAKFDEELLTNPQFYHFIEDRETVACTPVLYQTQWVKSIEKNELQTRKEPYQMITDKLGIFKLGETFSVICIYEPENQLLYFVRKASETQIKNWDNIQEYLSKQVNFQETRQKLLSLFNTIYSQKYSNFVLYSLLSADHFFISAKYNDVDLFRKLLPRVCELKIKAPFKASFFPYKNEEERMIMAPMQMSNEHTFVILDFSNFSEQKEIKIENQEIDNLKALKLYVEEGQTVYRWLYGQSLLKHFNTGLVVRASSIINPQYVVAQEIKQEQIKKLPEIPESDLRDFRCYIQKAREIEPLLKNDREQIEKKIHLQPKKFNQIGLVKVMELSKLSAKSKGSEEIKFQDFEHSYNLFF